MKVLCLAISREYFLTSASDYTKAIAREHEVYTCYPDIVATGLPNVKGHVPCNWHEFDFGPIKALQPDVIVTGNPRAAWNRAPMLLLKMQGFPMVFAEYGWLPQRHHFYFDPVGLGNESILTWVKTFNDKDVLKLHFDLQDAMNALHSLQQGYYNPRPKLRNIPAGDYIFVPLQWEWDSSIIFDSSYFKSMDHLIAFAAFNFPEFPIVVKAHPLDKNRKRNCLLPNVSYVEPETDPIALIQQSRAVFGINSTLLIEALVAEKPVAALGENVASCRGVFYEGKDLYQNPRGLLEFKPDKKDIALAINILLEWQILFSNPDMRKINRVLQLAIELN